jgi:hypothetical protein
VADPSSITKDSLLGDIVGAIQQNPKTVVLALDTIEGHFMSMVPNSVELSQETKT